MTLTLALFTLTFNPPGAMVTIYSHAKVQSQRSVDSEDRVEKKTDGRTDKGTDGRTEAIALPPTLMRSVIKLTNLINTRIIHCVSMKKQPL